MANVYLFGASGHGKVIKDILNANGIKVEAFVDDKLRVNEGAGRKVLHDAGGVAHDCQHWSEQDKKDGSG